jgi:shikimate dehydrogenase
MRCFVIGYPLNYTLSPIIHNAWYSAYRLKEYSFSAAKIDPKNLQLWLDKARSDAHSISITMPYKESILSLKRENDIIDEAVLYIGAANTVINLKGNFKYYNTDYYGIFKALSKKINNLKNKNILIFGYGGAARAAIFALKENKITICTRQDKSQILDFDKYIICNYNDNFLYNILPTVDIIINSTPVAIDMLIPKVSLKKDQVIFEMSYSNNDLFLPDNFVSPLEMLIYQAIKQFKLYSNLEINENELYQLAIEAIKSNK